nr:hypothetical protein [Hydrogenophaga sp. 2FB]
MFFLDRNEPQVVLPCDGIDGQTPVGAPLRDGHGHGVVRLGLHAEARRLRAVEQAVDQNACAAASVAVHHDAAGLRTGCRDRGHRVTPFKAGVTPSVDDALHAAIARDQFQGRRQQRPVVDAGGGVHQVDARGIAFTPPGGHQTARAAHTHGLDADALAHQLAGQPIEAHAMAADQNEIGRIQTFAQQLHLDRSAFVQDLGVLANRDEAIGAAEGGHRTRSLAHGIRAEAPLGGHQAHQEVLGAAPFRVDAHRQRRRHVLVPGLQRQTGERPDHRRQEFVEREDGRGRKAGQDDHGLAVGDGQAHRLAGLERHAVRDDARIAEGAHHTVGKIALTFGRAARKNDRVVRQSLGQRARQRGLVVRDDAQVHGHTAQLFDGGADDRRVGVVHGADGQGFAGRDDLIARGEDGHARLAVDAHIGQTQCRENADFARAQRHAGAQHGFSTRDVRARIADVLAGRDRAPDLYAAVRDVGVLHHHHRIRAARQHAAGGDGGCQTAPHLLTRRDAGREDLAGECQRARLLLHGAPGVRGLYREAVDIGTIETGHVDGSGHIHGQHPVQGGTKRDGFMAQRCQIQVLTEPALGLVPRDDMEKLRLGFQGHS